MVLTPSSPKKQSLMPSSKLRRSLRAHGHQLSAIVQVGKGGVSDGLIKQLQQALADHELVKLRVAGEGPDDRFKVAERLASLPGVNIVQIVGGAILVYKRHPRLPRFEGERARPAAETPVVSAGAKERGATAKKGGAKRERKPERRGAKVIRKRATKGR